MKNTNNDLHWMDSFVDPFVKKIPDSLKYLVPVLDRVYRDDQKFRSISNPSLYRKHIKQQSALDKKNVSVICEVIDKYGWLGKRELGVIGASAVSMVMIHSPNEIKLKYYETLIKALRNNRVGAETVAMYEDKLNASMNRKQHYGTQVIQFEGISQPYPVYDLDSLAGIRKRMNLLPLETYLTRFRNQNFTIEQYRLDLPKIISQLHVNDSSPIHVDIIPILDTLQFIRY